MSKLRASEALMAGSLLIRPQVGLIANLIDNSGCALGMILVAHSQEIFRSEDFRVVYPWLGTLRVSLPCGCKNKYINPRVASCIAHVFDHHIMGHPPLRWTLEQLADWIESVDPTPKTTTEDIVGVLATSDWIGSVKPEEMGEAPNGDQGEGVGVDVTAPADTTANS